MKPPSRLLSGVLPAALLLGALLVGIAPRARAQGATVVIVPKKADPNQLISFRFQQAEIDDVLRFLADATGKIVFKDPAVTGQITIQNQSQIPVSQALRLVQTILSLKGYALIENPDTIIVTTTAEAASKRSTKVSVGKDVDSIPMGKEIITHIFPLANTDAVRLREELQPLFANSGTRIIANSDTNSLVVVDEADNIRRIATIINLLDKALSDEITVEVIRLKYADAAEMARYLTELFRPEDQNRGQQPQPQPGGMAQPMRGNLAQLRGRVRIAADARSNSLIVYASPANQKSVRELVEQLDVNLTPRTEYRIIELKYADAQAMADQLTQLVDPNASRNRGGFFFGGFGGGGSTSRDSNNYGDFRVVPDPRTNSLIVTAPVDAVTNVVDLIRSLDKPTAVKDVVRTFQLENAIASEVATTLRNLFQGTQSTGGGLGFGLFGAGGRTQLPPGSPLDLLRQVTIIPNDQTNQLLVSGPAQAFPVIEELLRPGEGLDRRLPQVFIEVVIADVTLDDLTKFGIEFNAVSGTSSFGTNFGLTSPTADSTGFRYSIVSQNFQATLQALRTTDKIKIVSTPHVMVTDNSPALISIGERIPYAGQTTVTNGVAQSSVEFQDVAITLNVTPHISPGTAGSSGHILMDIDQVVNSLISFINVSPDQIAPRTTSRRAGTTVIVGNDQTVVLGGIISNDDKRTVNKVPILGDIPLLGALFRNTTRSKDRTELVVFLTPHIVRDLGDADDIRAYERGRLQVDPLTRLQAPFTRPLDLTPDRLRRGPAKPGEESRPGDEPRPGTEPRQEGLRPTRGLLPGPGTPPRATPNPGKKALELPAGKGDPPAS